MKKPTRAETLKHEEKGKRLLSAVERLLASNASITTAVAECQARAKSKGEPTGAALRKATASELVKRYSDRAALVGGAASLPALVPGIGSLALGLTGALAELGVLLKLEVELALALSHLFGFDIEDPKERQIAFVMASVGTYDASGGNFFADLARAEGVALWNYGPRQLGKFVVTAMTAVALGWVWRGFVRLVPFVGIAVGTGVNKVLTVRVGERIARDLETRVSLGKPAPEKKRARKPAAARAKKPARKAAVKAPGDEPVAH